MTIDGKTIPVNFGVNWFYKFYNETSGKDLMTGFAVETSLQVLEFCVNIYYAGYMAASKMDKFTPEITKEQIEDHVMSLNMAEATKLMNDYTNTVKKSQPEGEEQAQQQEGNP